MIIEYGTNDEGWNKIRSIVTEAKQQNPNFRVIDVGGTVHGHSSEFTDLIVDFNCTPDDKNISIDICNEEEWIKIKEIVDQKGKFDYAICTHTLEDVYNPVTSLKWLPRIAKAGIITTPSLFTELSRHENPEWLGYIHHKWIFDQEDGEMLVVPKMNCLENILGKGCEYNHDMYEIRYHWNETIPYRMFMNNYLGPNVDVVVDRFKELFLG